MNRNKIVGYCIFILGVLFCVLNIILLCCGINIWSDIPLFIHVFIKIFVALLIVIGYFLIKSKGESKK